ncbi:MAG: cation:proton antiporter [Chloroflexi bacterium]|nr:cation:proton antiporter [Chloroflexota bacterium]
MIETDVMDTLLQIALGILVALLIPVAYRAARGPTVADRLLAIDLVTTLLIGNIILVALIEGNDILIDIGIVLAALSFIAILSIARYISEGRVF